MPAPKISATIITLNEEANIARCIQSLDWVDEVWVVDSGSTDKTLELAKKLGAKTVINPWPGYGKQKNFAQEQASHEWILNLDADEVVSDDLKKQILEQLKTVETQYPVDAQIAFAFPRKTFYLGRWIRHGGWYPNYVTRLARKSQARWTEPTIHESLQFHKINNSTPQIIRLTSPLLHYTFSSIQDQILTNLRYSQFGSMDLKKRGVRGSLIRLLLKPIGKFIETYIIKKGFLDGLPGLIISVNAAHSMFLKYAYLIEAELGAHAHSDRR